MSLPLNDEHRALAESVRGFVGQVARTDSVRDEFAGFAAGGRPKHWPTLLAQGLHGAHLPESVGGAGGGLLDLSVIVEECGKGLLPGPFLPTVLTSAVLAAADRTCPAVAEPLRSCADGATGAFVSGAGLSATEVAGGWLVTGESAPVVGLPGAEIVLVRVTQVDGEPLWFVVPADRCPETVVPDNGVDLTRSVGRLVLRGYRVRRGEALPQPAEDAVDLVVNALVAAEASGIIRWCLDTVVEHVSGREQFGRPVGSFQAVQHKAAMLLVHAEIACASAWDAARAEGTDYAQQRIAAAQAAITAPALAVDCALDSVTLLGGIGFTWEHDAHLYWRRAISIASVVGAERDWSSRLGSTALSTHRDFGLAGAEAPELRAYVAEVLAEVNELPSDPVGAAGLAWSGPRRNRLASARLVAPHYPEPYGIAAGPAEQAVISEEFALAGLDQPTTVVGEWVLPTLLTHGSAEQQQRFVGPTLRGEIVWCQLFSEPEAGSDLAGLRTSARKVEGGWSISGQKVWTSMAHEADWGVCLARTDPGAAKHRGLSYFVIDMRSPGIEVRPLRQATGRTEFNEVFLDEVFVPDDSLVGSSGSGWKLAVTTLSHERLSMGSVQFGHGGTDAIRRLLADGAPVRRSDAIRVLGENTAREIARSTLNLRAMHARLADLDPGAEMSVLKVYSAIAQRSNSRALLTLLGSLGCVATGESDPVIDHIGLPAVLLGGGTIEIQLNVIAQRVLGLPREPMPSG
ncbi:alkylation response protein AidB-like acyl-CoA dehydrogenase [Tamaricihabitans halophyticus]|uniref:Alkylation response protein AidB-like acyl-CoA dehydrogenase n=1 Tax=Tamaricihabitans halophyticus TaxID=1262583 RepID=A0A4R2QA00_9PSEU|nr:acyl-CoA dehydrogenase [Tamaricihabitans halophyticus]TCP45747.1 alkylation response protein AidB-like acyl-CoA dehydrogenase [Tamaricihabitans halophyticus]